MQEIYKLKCAYVIGQRYLLTFRNYHKVSCRMLCVCCRQVLPTAVGRVCRPSLTRSLTAAVCMKNTWWQH